MKVIVFASNDISFLNFRKELLLTPIKITNGYVPVQTSPGLGIEVNNEIIKKYKIN